MRLQPMTAASVKPKKKVRKSVGLAITCLSRIAIPTQGRSEPSAKSVFMGRPSMGRLFMMKLTMSWPKYTMTNVGMKEQTMWEIQGRTMSTR